MLRSPSNNESAQEEFKFSDPGMTQLSKRLMQYQRENEKRLAEIKANHLALYSGSPAQIRARLSQLQSVSAAKSAVNPSSPAQAADNKTQACKLNPNQPRAGVASEKKIHPVTDHTLAKKKTGTTGETVPAKKPRIPSKGSADGKDQQWTRLGRPRSVSASHPLSAKFGYDQPTVTSFVRGGAAAPTRRPGQKGSHV